MPAIRLLASGAEKGVGVETMLTGLLLVSGIAALLAFLLEVADFYIADYGECTLTVNDEKKFAVKGGSPLLFTLMDNGIFLPSACGGKGTCAYCKAKVISGGGPLLPTETPYLSNEERAGGVRITCQVKVKEDMTVEIPREYFQIREYRVRVDGIEELTDDIDVVRFRILSPEEGITFVPGQYVQLQVPAYKESRTSEYRAYSIASDARDHRNFELVIAKVEGGIVSTYVHDYMRMGEELVARGPFGDFCLTDSDRDILLIATGSGLAPIRSILYQIEHEGIQRKTMLFFGDRRPSDLYFFDEMKGFEKRLHDFRYVPVLSRTVPEDGWTGEKGRVTDLIQRYIPDQASVDVHICGSPQMVNSCVGLLTHKGIPAHRISYDKFE